MPGKPFGCLAAESADVVRATLDTRADGGSLRTADGIAELSGALPADWLVFGTYDLEEMMVASLDASAEMSGISSDAFAALLEDQPMRGAFAVSAEGFCGQAFSAGLEVLYFTLCRPRRTN